MNNEQTITGNQNISVQDIKSGATVNITQILNNSFQYNDLLDKIKTKQELFDLLPEENTERRLAVSAELNELKDTLEEFKKNVIALAETFGKIEINTDRLRRAKEFFDQGDIGESRAVLETELEQMRDEQKYLLEQKDRYDNEILPNLINNSEEFYLLAMSTQTDYENPNRFETTCKYFEDSIKSYPTKDNVFNYALFLQEHTRFNEAEKLYYQYLNDFKYSISEYEYAGTLNNLANLHQAQNRYDEALREYEEALTIYRKLAETNPNTYLPFVALTLNNLANLHRAQNRYDEALREYEEALTIRRKLAETNLNTFLPDVAMTLNNLANLHSDQNRYDEALREYEEALTVYRKLAETNPNTYLPFVALTLNNLAVLHSDQNRYDEALREYEEALTIRRKLAETNPNTYLPDVAMTLNNLAVLHSDQNRYDEALREFEDALTIRRKLAETNPNTFLPDVASTLNNLALLHSDQNRYDEALSEYEEALEIRESLAKKNPMVYEVKIAQTNFNMAILYQDNLHDRDKSISCILTTIEILSKISDVVIYTRKYLEASINILKNWDLSDEEISQMIAERVKGNE